MWSLNTNDQSELKLSSGNKFVGKQTEGQTDGQADYYRAPTFKKSLIKSRFFEYKWQTRDMFRHEATYVYL